MTTATTPDVRQFIPGSIWELTWTDPLYNGETRRYQIDDAGRVWRLTKNGGRVKRPIAPWTLAVRTGRAYTARQMVRVPSPDGVELRYVDEAAS